MYIVDVAMRITTISQLVETMTMFVYKLYFFSGISTPPTVSTIPNRVGRSNTLESTDEPEVAEEFTANLADIILFDPSA